MQWLLAEDKMWSINFYFSSMTVLTRGSCGVMNWAGVLSDIQLFKVTQRITWQRNSPTHEKRPCPSVALVALLPFCHYVMPPSVKTAILFTTDGSASTLLNRQSCTGFAAPSPLQIRLTTQRGKWLAFQKRVMVHWFPGSYFAQSFCNIGESQVYFSFHRQCFNIFVLFTRYRMRQLGFHLLKSIIHVN